MNMGVDQARGKKQSEPPEQWLLLIECDDEKQQVELLERFQKEGLRCKALLAAATDVSSSCAVSIADQPRTSRSNKIARWRGGNC